MGLFLSLKIIQTLVSAVRKGETAHTSEVWNLVSFHQNSQITVLMSGNVTNRNNVILGPSEVEKVVTAFK